jgi:hypothetical protein
VKLTEYVPVCSGGGYLIWRAPRKGKQEAKVALAGSGCGAGASLLAPPSSSVCLLNHEERSWSVLLLSAGLLLAGDLFACVKAWLNFCLGYIDRIDR